MNFLGILNYNSFPLKESILCGLFLIIIILFIFFYPIKFPYLNKIKKYSFSFNHKKIGKLYIFLSFLMLIRGFVDALMMRIQQAFSFNHKGYLENNHYCQIFTAHGDIMIFFVAMPFMVGIMNIIIPLQIETNDVVFPSLNLLSFWLTFISSIIINISLLFGEFSKTGWLAYPPLSERTFSPWIGMEYWIWSIQISGISTLITSINFITTIFKCRKKKNFLFNSTIFIWTCLCSNILILISFPILTILLLEIFLDRNFNFHFFTSFYGGQPMLYVNYIWAWGHPEVYILILPSFGIFSEIIINECKKKIFSNNSLIYATISITLLSFLVWLHHFFTMGSGYLPNIYYSIMTTIIAIPTGVKIFNWIFSIIYSKFNLNNNSIWFIFFLIVFSIGGFAGIILSIPCLDYIFHNSLFLIAHFHFVIIGGVLFGYLAGLNYWYYLIFNKNINIILSYINSIFWFIGILLSFFPLYILGYFGAMRRNYIYFNKIWEVFFFISLFGSIIIMISIFTSIILYFFNKKKLKYCKSYVLKSIYLNNNDYYYKKIFFKKNKIFFIHNSSRKPFLISINILLFIFCLIWCMWKLFFLFLFLLFYNIMCFLYEK